MALNKEEIDKVNNLYKENDTLKAELSELKTVHARLDGIEAMLKEVLEKTHEH